ncbi:MAG: ketoacyl-ACP synthase III [Deltaproteobacteria bacterium]|nr:ketoacyl-ACP synthase III [Deltaproteobacteria bacterium]
MKKTTILGTGSYLPSKVLTNHDLSQILDTNDEWIVSRTGIRERRIVAEGQTCSDLAYEASLKALEDAALTPNDLDMIIVATLTPEKRLPSTACLLQDKLQAKKAAVYDIDAACSGFVYGMSIADQYIKTGAMNRILVAGTEVMSKVLNWKDRSTCILFGDGAGSAVLGPAKTEEKIILSTHLFSNGSLYKLLEMPAGGTAMEWTPDVFERGDHLVKMDGKQVFRQAIESMAEASRLALEKFHKTIDDIDLFIPHQANSRIMDAIAKRLKCPEEKIFMNVDKYGNTSGASIPIALDEAIKQGRLKKGDLLLIATFGAGFAWGSALIRW